METVLDIECTFTKIGDKTNPTPFHPDNKLVSLGYKNATHNNYHVFNHKSLPNRDNSIGISDTQRVLTDTTLLIGHNLKFDLNWITECGLTYEGEVWDTMIFEYVLAKGMKTSISLDDSVERYQLGPKSDILEKYIAEGKNVDEIPIDELIEYGKKDVDITYELYLKQKELLEYSEEVQSMWPAIKLMFDFLPCLAEMERNGVAIDSKTLSEIKKEYQLESVRLTKLLDEMVAEVMGDTPINLNSSEQLSWVVYSRRVKDKKLWADSFNLGQELRNGVWKNKYPTRYKATEFAEVIRQQTTKLRKTNATHCTDCQGTGKLVAYKKNGAVSKRTPKCGECFGKGIIYEDAGTWAGFRVTPLSYEYASAGGFSTSTETISALLEAGKLSLKAKEFLATLSRKNAIDTYLNTFIEGIERNVISGLLHPNFNQCIAATGRLTSSQINMQNMPREKTFPVRKAFISRFEGGLIGDADAAQLEFRTAGELSRDTQIYADIQNKVDIHAFTRDTLNAAGMSVDRQDAKSRTFKPIYGGQSGSEAEMVYFKAFLAKYKGLDRWQQELAEKALKHKQIQTPSGRIYAFPFAERDRRGRVKGFTQIVNYPVQGFATGDIIPAVIIEIWKLMKGMQSKIILTVHDSITIDIHPTEVNEVVNIVKKVFDILPEVVYNRFKHTLWIPLEYEMSIGRNWMEKEKCH